jgi:hypothetical protein
MRVKNGLENAAQDWAVLLLAALGISLAPHVFWGGLFLALCLSMVARHFLPERDRQEIWLVLLAAAIMAILTAEGITWLQATDRLSPQFPAQMAMAAAGFASRWVIHLGLRILNRVEDRGDEVADRIFDHVLPDKRDQKSEKEDKP